MATSTTEYASVRYLVDDVQAAVDFYTGLLGSGYCGWSTGELQRAVDDGAWHVAPALFSDLLYPMHMDLWSHAFSRTYQASPSVGEAGAPTPLNADERQSVLEDLDDLSEFAILLSPYGIRGVNLDEQYYDWDQLRVRLLYLFRDGQVGRHVPPDPLARNSYVSWDYCRGYRDNGLAELGDDTVFNDLTASTAEVDELLRSRDLSPESADPLNEHERLIVREDLADVELAQAILEPRGIVGQVIRCDECQRDHHYPWVILRANLRQLLEHGTATPHGNPAPLDLEAYATRDYCRGFIDSITRMLDSEKASHTTTD